MIKRTNTVSEAPAIDVLTAREVQTLAGLAAGYSNREIAVQYGVSTKTIDTHRGNVLEKLGLGCNADLTRYAIAFGLVDFDGNRARVEELVEAARARRKHGRDAAVMP